LQEKRKQKKSRRKNQWSGDIEHTAISPTTLAIVMRVFVTGAASPLGRALVSALVRRNNAVVGLVRRVAGVAQMRNLGAEPLVGDVRRPEHMVKAMAGCEIVFHLASFFDFWAKKPEDFDSVNVGGTKSVMAAATAAKVRRVIHCGSAITIGAPNGQVGDEFTRHRGHTETEFERSQLAGEKLALRMSKHGVEVVVVNTGLVVAPADPGWTGRLIAQCVQGKPSISSHAPLSWVWVEDAVEGLMRAAIQGHNGDRFILSGDVMSSHDFLTKVAVRARKKSPRALPKQLAMSEAALATALAAPFGQRPRLAMDEARFLTSGFRVDGTHASSELGLEYTPASRYINAVVNTYQSALNRFTK
jgi:dihydroflavonol-4-reductase